MKTRAVDFDGCNDEDEAKRGETTSDKIMKNEEEKLWKIYHPELEGLQIRRISAKKWLFLLVLQAGTRRSREFGYHDMGILKGNKCSRGECSEYKTHEGAQ